MPLSARARPGSEPGLAQFIDGTQQPRDHRGALLTRPVFLQQQITQPLLEAIDHLQSRMRPQIGRELVQLLGSEIVPMRRISERSPRFLEPTGSRSRQQFRKWWFTNRITWKRSATMSALGNVCGSARGRPRPDRCTPRAPNSCLLRPENRPPATLHSCPTPHRLGGHPKPANEGQLKTGQ